MNFDRKNLTDQTLIDIYKALITPRLIEERMLILLRQGKISKWFSGIGQEAISVGAALVLNEDEYILPMHRNLGVFTTRKVPLERLFAQFQGKIEGFTKGRDRSFHFGSREHRIVGMISHLGAQLSVADGIALGHQLRDTQKVTLVFTGDGGTSEGEFHEALNVAAVWNLPVIFVIENNGYGLSTPSSEQFKIDSFVQKGPGYGIDAISIDGNNILEVFHELDEVKKAILENPRPFMVEAVTFRMRGHEEASGTKYVPKKLMDQWQKKDPIENYEKYLLSCGVLSESTKEDIHKEVKQQIEVGLMKAYSYQDPVPNTANEETDVFYPYQQKVIEPPGKKVSEKRFVNAISEGLHAAMEHHDNLILMGQDIAEYGGVFKVTEGFVEKFGRQRVKNTPLCESAILGAALGLSINGFKSMVEMQFADFVSCGFNQIANNLAKAHYRWGQNADVVIRMPTGAGVAAGPFHSQSTESWFFHIPGLKIVYPSNPYDAKGLLLAAFEDPNPFLFFEHKYLYRSISDTIPEGYFTSPIGKASILKEGTDFCIITYGMGVHWANEMMLEEGFNATLVDLRTLAPWDKTLVERVVKKTGKVIIIHEDTITGGIGAEIAAWISDNCFEHLDAPVLRLGSLDTPVPFSPKLEENFLPKNRLKQTIEKLLRY